MNSPLDKPADPSLPRPASSRRIHPLVAAAAGAVIVASLAVTASVSGVFSKASGSAAQNDRTQAAQVIPQQPVVDSAAPVNGAAQQAGQAPAAAPAPVPGQAQQLAQQPPAQSAQSAQPTQPAPLAAAAATPQYAQQPAPAQPAYCASCGTVVAVSEVRHEGHGTGIGAVGGALAGGVVGNQFGRGGGRTAMTLLGAVGGGLAGNSVEKHVRTTTSYSVRVRMDNGKTRYFTYRDAPPFQQGEHVRVEHGSLVAG